jgi:hypothetical protein
MRRRLPLPWADSWNGRKTTLESEAIHDILGDTHPNS